MFYMLIYGKVTILTEGASMFTVTAVMLKKTCCDTYQCFGHPADVGAVSSLYYSHML